MAALTVAGLILQLGEIDRSPAPAGDVMPEIQGIIEDA
jgi:hypothetical protein